MVTLTHKCGTVYHIPHTTYYTGKKTWNWPVGRLFEIVFEKIGPISSLIDCTVYHKCWTVCRLCIPQLWYSILLHIHISHPSVIFKFYVYNIVLDAKLKAFGRWHRSKETISGFSSYGGWYGRKKWHDFDVGIKCTINDFELNLFFQICAKHLLHFQQAILNKRESQKSHGKKSIIQNSMLTLELGIQIQQGNY